MSAEARQHLVSSVRKRTYSSIQMVVFRIDFQGCVCWLHYNFFELSYYFKTLNDLLSNTLLLEPDICTIFIQLGFFIHIGYNTVLFFSFLVEALDLLSSVAMLDISSESPLSHVYFTTVDQTQRSITVVNPFPCTVPSNSQDKNTKFLLDVINALINNRFAW